MIQKMKIVICLAIVHLRYPINIDYSHHENFSDLSTIQYHPVYQIKPIYDFTNK